MELLRVPVRRRIRRFEAFFLDRVNLAKNTPRDHPDLRRLHLEIVRKHSQWLQPATLEPAELK